MFKKSLLSLAVASSIALTGCLDSGNSTNNTNPQYGIENPAIDGKTWPLFNPVTRELPAPTDLQFSGTTDGTMFAGTDANPVIQGIDHLEGNSTIAQFDIKFSGGLNPDQTLDASSFILQNGLVIPNPNQNVFLLPLVYPGGDGLLQARIDGASVEIPSFSEAATYQGAVVTSNATTLAALASPVARAEIISLDGGANNVLRISPLKPLLPETKYLVVITNKVQDANGHPVIGSPTYSNLRDASQPLGSASLAPVRTAILGWERLAAGYFGFMQQMYTALGVSLTAPSVNDVVFSITFTTTGTDSILKSIAAPSTFLKKSLDTTDKQSAIVKLVSGTYNLNGVNTALTDATDIAINSTIKGLLTNTLSPLYNATIANAITDADAAGATLGFSAFSSNSTAQFIVQTAAATAAVQVKGATNQATATGTAAALTPLLPTPKARTNRFYSTNVAANTVNAALPAQALVSQGEITLPYYLTKPTDTSGSNIKTSVWTADNTLATTMGRTLPSEKVTYRWPFPAKTADVTVPVLATYPNGTITNALGKPRPAAGWPVIIYQHGITTDRSATLPLATAYATACINADLAALAPDCFATVAIDQPLHGVAPAGSTVNGLTSVSDPNNVPVDASTTLTERHFNFTSDAATNPIAMSYGSATLGSSGSLFINLSNFANSRDNLRQGSVDLFNLAASLSSMDIDGNPANQPDLDVSRVYFIGHSLGGVNGLPFVAINNEVLTANTNLPGIKAATFLNTGGGVPKLLENSPNTSFGAPVILQGLAAAGLTQGTSDFESYMRVLQGVLDSVDPMNFGAKLKTGSAAVLMTEIVGDGTSAHPSDRTIPNAADAIWGKDPLNLTLGNGFTINSLKAPLAGTEPLIAQVGATNILSYTTGTPKVVTKFTEGSHGTPVSASNTTADPLTSGAVFNEMLAETLTLFTSNGASITAANQTVIKQ